MNGLAAKVATALAEDPYCGHVFVFRGRRGDMLKVLWWSGDGLCLLAKRLETGPLRLAACKQRLRLADAGAAVDAARRDRLAPAGAHLAANVSLVNVRCLA
jgi:hypothetical protein